MDEIIVVDLVKDNIDNYWFEHYDPWQINSGEINPLL
jgi:hypothetical protein